MNLPENLDILVNEELSKHTTLGIGGPADYFIKIKNKPDLYAAMDFVKANNLPVTIIGKGSKLLVTDKGVRGAVIMLTGMDFLAIEGRVITAEANVSLIRLAKLAVSQALRGLEWAVGIPASIGGATVMNAGAYDGSMADIVSEVEYFDGEKISIIKGEDCEFGYRQSIFLNNPQYIITTVKMELVPDKKERLEEIAEKYVEHRRLTQPQGRTAGSVFKKINGKSAGAILDEAGLKGYRIGDISISEVHANFIVNNGNATFKDAVKLIEYMKKILKKRTGTEPDLEIQILGEQ